jgi:hypothetical protein
MIETYVSALSPYALFGHIKTSDRFVKTMQTLGSKFGQSIPRSCASVAETEGVYHFLNSSRVTHPTILLSERDRLLAEVSDKNPAVLLSIGDVTTLEYSTRRSAPKMGHVSSKNRHGYQVLSQLVCEADGVPMGLLSQYAWNYKLEELGKRRQRQHLPIEEKESGYYLRQIEELQEYFGDRPATRIIHLFDRAGDVHELLQARQYEHIHYIIRSKNDRKLLGSNTTIRQFLDQQSVAGCYEIKTQTRSKKSKGLLKIEKQRAQKVNWRPAKLEVSFAKVTLKASNASKNRPLKPVDVYVVRARELDAPPNVEAVEWTLLSSLPVESLADAFYIIDCYVLRWQIEVFHYTLKQGAKVEQLQLGEVQAVLNAVALYSLLAVQVQRLRYLAEKQPDQPIEQAGYSQQDYYTLATYLNSVNGLHLDPLKQNVSTSEFVRLISILGGNHKNTSIGVRSVWCGMRDFKIVQDAYRVFSSA